MRVKLATLVVMGVLLTACEHNPMGSDNDGMPNGKGGLANQPGVCNLDNVTAKGVNFEENDPNRQLPRIAKIAPQDPSGACKGLVASSFDATIFTEQVIHKDSWGRFPPEKILEVEVPCGNPNATVQIDFHNCSPTPRDGKFGGKGCFVKAFFGKMPVCEEVPTSPPTPLPTTSPPNPPPTQPPPPPSNPPGPDCKKADVKAERDFYMNDRVVVASGKCGWTGPGTCKGFWSWPDGSSGAIPAPRNTWTRAQEFLRGKETYFTEFRVDVDTGNGICTAHVGLHIPRLDPQPHPSPTPPPPHH